MANGIFIAENLASTKLSSLLKTGRYVDGGAVPATIQNGRVVTLGALEAGEREVFVATDVAANTDEAYVVDAPELQYSQEITLGLNDFQNPAGTTLRLRKLAIGDIFAVSANAIDPIGADPVVTNFIATPAAGNQWAEVANAAGGQSVICEIIDTYVLGQDPLGGRNITMYGCKVVSA